MFFRFLLVTVVNFVIFCACLAPFAGTELRVPYPLGLMTLLCGIGGFWLTKHDPSVTRIKWSGAMGIVNRRCNRLWLATFSLICGATIGKGVTSFYGSLSNLTELGIASGGEAVRMALAWAVLYAANQFWWYALILGVPLGIAIFIYAGIALGIELKKESANRQNPGAPDSRSDEPPAS